jgi:glycosyltransferase involved in cell wall biosynthesis
MLQVIILTKNEEIHLERCILSLSSLECRISVIDSASDDRTVQIAESLGAKVYFNPWINYSNQFNWAIDNTIDSHASWVLRLDADEILAPELVDQINNVVRSGSDGVNGYYVNRRMRFLGDDVNRGGIFPVKVLRLFRVGFGSIEDRWMDEHLVVKGTTGYLDGYVIDDNLKSLSWWIDKHNSYSNREALDVLNDMFSLFESSTVASDPGYSQAKIKRLLKERVYNKMPLMSRARLYFIYRYYLRLGFLDTPGGKKFHFLQGYWYRTLVNYKIGEVLEYANRSDVDISTAVKTVLGIDISKL